jgi:hypothetical protein
VSPRPAATTEHPSTPVPFGKFKGTLLEDLPAHYIVWLSRLENLRDPLRARVVEELGRRVLRQSKIDISEGDDDSVPF